MAAVPQHRALGWRSESLSHLSSVQLSTLSSAARRAALPHQHPAGSASPRAAAAAAGAARLLPSAPFGFTSDKSKQSETKPYHYTATGEGKGLARGRQPRLQPPAAPEGQALPAAALRAQGALPAPARPLSFCVEVESPPPRPLGPPQPAHSLPFAPTPQGRSPPEGERAGAASFPLLRSLLYPTFRPPPSARPGPAPPAKRGGEGRAVGAAPPTPRRRLLRPRAPSPRRRPLRPVPQPRRLLSTDIATLS